MKKISPAWFLTLAMNAATTAAIAADVPPADKPAEPAATPAIYSIGGFDLTGHADVGYTHLSSDGKFGSGVNNRVFDFGRNTAKLHALDLQLTKTPDTGWGGLFDVTLGKDADVIAAYGTIDKDKGPANGANHNADLTQAYVHFGAAPLTVIAGKYVTLAGAEYIKSPLNTNYSRSILFGYAIPFTHTGARATYKFSDELSLIGGINQGWDQFKDTNSDKTFELGALYNPSKTVALAATIYAGKENVGTYPAISSENGQRTLVDLLGTFNVTDNLTLILNIDSGSQDGIPITGKAKWSGVAGYANYTINDQWKLSFRAEQFKDDGYRTGIDQTWREATLTGIYLPNKNIELRAELRSDKSNKDAFLKSDGVTPTDKQTSFGIEMLYKF